MQAANRVAALLDDSLLSTLSALITTLPVIVYHFGHFSTLSLVSNLLILPVQPAVLFLGATAAITGQIWLHLGQLFGWVAWLFLTYTTRAVELTASWIEPSAAASAVHPAVPWAYYAVLAVSTLEPARRLIPSQAICQWLRAKALRKVGIAALICASILIWIAVAHLPDSRLHVAFLDVGQGDAIFIETPRGNRVLIDGGPSPAMLLAALGRHLPFWDRRIDLVLLSHPHDDHLRGLLAVLDRYDVRQVLVSNVSHTSSVAQHWRQQLANGSVPILAIQHPLQVDLGDGPIMTVFPPDVTDYANLDETSLVAQLSWQSVSFLFTGDLEAEGMLKLAQAGWPLACTVLKVPHHGSDQAGSENLLAVTCPDLAIISVGAGNRFGHPAQGTLAQLESAGAQVLRTDEVGAIEITTDGEAYWVRTTEACPPQQMAPR
jgi:competence protein ComEC